MHDSPETPESCYEILHALINNLKISNISICWCHKTDETIFITDNTTNILAIENLQKLITRCEVLNTITK